MLFFHLTNPTRVELCHVPVPQIFKMLLAEPPDAIPTVETKSSFISRTISKFCSSYSHCPCVGILSSIDNSISIYSRDRLHATYIEPTKTLRLEDYRTYKGWELLKPIAAEIETVVLNVRFVMEKIPDRMFQDFWDPLFTALPVKLVKWRQKGKLADVVSRYGCIREYKRVTAEICGKFRLSSDLESFILRFVIV